MRIVEINKIACNSVLDMKTAWFLSDQKPNPVNCKLAYAKASMVYFEAAQTFLLCNSSLSKHIYCGKILHQLGVVLYNTNCFPHILSSNITTLKFCHNINIYVPGEKLVDKES